MQIKIGDIVSGKVTGITKFGVFVALENNLNALIHISEVSDKYIKDIFDCYKVGDAVEAIVINISDDGKINLSVKSLINSRLKNKGPDDFFSQKVQAPASFEDMLNKFKQDSEQKSHDLKKSYEAKRGAPSRKKQ